jgi:hypothetical protein
MKRITRARQLVLLAGDELATGIGHPDTPANINDLIEDTTRLFERLKDTERQGTSARGRVTSGAAGKTLSASGETG